MTSVPSSPSPASSGPLSRRPLSAASPNSSAAHGIPRERDRPIVFFDGECGMCNRFVDLLLQLDPEGAIALAPLQGETARQILPPLPAQRQEWSIYYQDKTGLYNQSDAVLRICERLGGGWSMLAGFAGIPRPVRDGLYQWVARHRYQIMGQRSTCRMPTENERHRFLP